MALALYAGNVVSGGRIETWIHGGPLSGDPINRLPFGNHNTAALLLSACLPPTLLAGWSALRNRRPISGMAWSVSAATLSCLLWHTHSLGALLGLAAGAVLTLVAQARRPRLLGRLILAAGLAAPLMTMIWSSRPTQPSSWRLTSTFGVRTLIWESAGNAWRQAPLLGHGAGSFPLTFPACRAEAYPFSQYAQPMVRHAYNLPLQTLAETGLVGALLLAGVFAALLAAWREGSGGAARWTALALMIQALGGDALTDPLGLACFALAAAWALPAAGGAAPARRSGAWSLLALVLAGALLLQIPQAAAFATGHTAARRGEALRAEAAYARAASGLPSLMAIDARFERGTCLMHLGRDREALGAFRDLAALAGPYGNARAQAALAALRAGETREAIRLLEEHLAFDPCDLKARSLLASLAPQRREPLRAGLLEVLARVPDGHPLRGPAAAWLAATAPSSLGTPFWPLPGASR